MADVALDRELAVVRRRLADVVPDLAQINFEDNPQEVAAWLDGAAAAATRREFVLPEDDDPKTLYLWMNDFAFNLDRWFLTPFAMGPDRPAEGDFDWRDALIGDEIGSGLRVSDFTLTGMGSAREWFQDHAEAPERSAVEDVVLLSAFDLVAQSLPHAKAVPFRVAMSRGEEWRVCTWDTSEASPRLHTWQRSAD